MREEQLLEGLLVLQSVSKLDHKDIVLQRNHTPESGSNTTTWKDHVS